MEPAPTENLVWDEVAPQLDEALNHLSDADRQALLLRFFDQKTMRDVGRILGVSEDAAKMRVSRAVDRLRTRLADRGVACTAVALGAILAERSVEAAPAPLVAHLSAMRLPVSAGSGGLAGVFRTLWQGSAMPRLAGVAALVFIGAATITFLRALNSPRHEAIPQALRPPSIEAQREDTVRVGVVTRRGAAGSGPAAAREPAKVRLTLHVEDAEIGGGLADAKIHAVYFYAGGRGEPHELSTDANGSAAIPEALELHDHGMNIFVFAEGHVPKSMSFMGNDTRTEYTLKLDPALSVGGTVVDGQGQPVAGVKIQVQPSGEHKEGTENIDFQTSATMSDENGRWLCTFIPRDYREIQFILTRDDYAVTLPIVPMDKVNLMSLVLVIDRGFTVTGRITDLAGLPIGEARVNELNTLAYRRQSTQTDADGVFTLSGLSQCDSYRGQAPETNDQGAVIIRGLLGVGKPHVELVVQAGGFAPMARIVELLEPTNVINFALTNGNVFRGRVLDEAGNPIANAAVRTDVDDQGLRKYVWQTRTDADGRFEWDSAPAEPVLFWFEADGYKWLRDVLLTADGSEHSITLARQGGR